MTRLVVLCVAFLVACNARIGGVSGGDDTPIDAAGGDDEPADASIASPDAPACFNGRVVYLNFDGATLTKATPSDARASTASWIGRTDGRTQATVPRYRSGAADRDQQIATIVANVRAALAQFPVIVVTDRPASGDYVMVVFGGVNTDLGTPYSIATNELDCGDTNRNDVAWVSDTTASAKVDDYAIGAIGFGLGLTGTTSTSDCMCGWANGCRQPVDTQCALSAATVQRDPAADQQCAGLTTQNAVDTFDQAFCR